MRYSSVAIISVAGQLISLGLAFLFHFLMARILGLSTYGELGVLLSTFTILIFPVISIQAILMREVAKLQLDNKSQNISWLITTYLKQSLLISLPLSAIAFISLYATGLITDYLSSLMVLMSVPIFYSIFIYNSYLQGLKKPLHFASILVSSDLLRLLISLLLVYYGFSLFGAALSYLIGSIILFVPILLLFYIKNKKNSVPYKFSLKEHLIYIFPTYLFFAFLLAADLFFVRYFSDAKSVGLYTAASTLARAIFFVSVGLTNAFLPHSSQIDLKKEFSKIVKPLLVSFFVLLIFSVGLFVTKDLLLSTLYGLNGVDLSFASSILGTLTISIFFLALSILLTNLMWSQNEQKLPLQISIFGALIAICLLFLFTGGGGAKAADASLVYNILLFVLLSAATIHKFK